MPEGIIFLLISAPSLGVYYCQQFTLSVCHKLQIASSFLFLDGVEPFFGFQFSVTPSTKCSYIFDLCPPTPTICSPKFAQNRLYKSACMADRPEMFGPTRGFSGWPITLNLAKCCGADPCCHGNEIWVRRGDPVAYRLVLSVRSSVRSCVSLTKERLLTRYLGKISDRFSPPNLCKIDVFLCNG